MADPNRYGLRRHIPDPVKRAVRQRDGFGCVICGKAIYEYEHFDPEFTDAKEHNANGIVLLCIEHHGKKTRGLLSKDTVKLAAENPRCLQEGFSWDAFDIGTEHPTIVLGNITAIDCKTLI